MRRLLRSVAVAIGVGLGCLLFVFAPVGVAQAAPLHDPRVVAAASGTAATSNTAEFVVIASLVVGAAGTMFAADRMHRGRSPRRRT